MAILSSNTIAIVVPAIAREGISKLVLSQIGGLQQKGHDVVMVVLSSMSQEMLVEMNVHLPAGQLLILNQRDAYLSAKNFFVSPRLLTSIIGFFRQHKIKVVIAHAPFAHYVMRLVKLRLQFDQLNIKLIQYFHITQYAQFPLSTARRIVVNELNKLLGKAYDNAHISVSHAVKDDINFNLFKHKCHWVIANALPLETGNQNRVSLEAVGRIDAWLNDRSNSFKVLVPGRLSYMKGQLFFLQVLAEFIRVNHLNPQDLAILIVGDGPDKEAIEKLIAEKGLSDYCFISAALKKMALAQVTALVDLVAVPSHFEGFGLVALEALQSRRLVLSSDAGGLKEVIKHGYNGLVFRAGDAADCLEKLQLIYENRCVSLLDLDKMAEQVEQTFSFERHMEQLIKAIELVEAA